MALARRRGPRVGRITDLYVTPAARRTASRRRCAAPSSPGSRATGSSVVDLEVMASNTAARAIYARWGFRDEVLVLAAPVAVLAERLGEPAAAPSFGSIHVQTDDVDVIVKAVEMYVPRLPGPLDGLDRDPAARRVRDGLRRRLRPRPGDVAAPREGDLVPDRARRDHRRRRGGGGRADDPLRPRRHRRRVRVGARVPRAAAAGRGIALHANPVVVERYTGAHAGGGARSDACRRLARRPAARSRGARRARRRARPHRRRARLGRRARPTTTSIRIER